MLVISILSSLFKFKTDVSKRPGDTQVSAQLCDGELQVALQHITRALHRVARVEPSLSRPLYGLVLMRSAQLRCERARQLLNHGDGVEALWNVLLASVSRKVSLECMQAAALDE